MFRIPGAIQTAYINCTVLESHPKMRQKEDIKAFSLCILNLEILF